MAVSVALFFSRNLKRVVREVILIEGSGVGAIRIYFKKKVRVSFVEEICHRRHCRGILTCRCESSYKKKKKKRKNRSNLKIVYVETHGRIYVGNRNENMPYYSYYNQN